MLVTLRICFLNKSIVKKLTKTAATVYNRRRGYEGNTMLFPIIPAHGALGPFDELIMLGAAVIFLVMMGISWVKSRNTRPEFVETEEIEETVEREILQEPDRFRLD